MRGGHNRVFTVSFVLRVTYCFCELLIDRQPPFFGVYCYFPVILCLSGPGFSSRTVNEQHWRPKEKDKYV